MRAASCLLSVIALAAPISANAQNIAGVPGPVIKEGERSAQFRLAFDPDTDELVQRLHYQQSLNSKVRWRIQLQSRSGPAETIEADFVQGQLWLQLTPDNSDDTKRLWHSGVRLDLRLEADGPPGRAAINWTNQFQLSKTVSARFFVQGAVQIGDGAVDGVLLQGRSHLNWQLNDAAIGIEQFNTFGATSNLPSFSDQSHLIGPYARIPLGNGWSLFGSALFGITLGSDNANLRIFVGKSF